MKLRLPRKKTLLYLLLALILTTTASIIGGVQYAKYKFFQERPNTVNFEGELQPMPFQWSEAKFGDHVEPHYAMLIEVSVPDVENRFFMQFDTGSPYSFLRSGALDSLRDHGVDFELVNSSEGMSIKSFALNVNGNRVTLNGGHVSKRSSSIDWDNPEAINILGTIGADFLDKKVCVIDFPNQEIRLHEDRPVELNANGKFSPFSFAGRRIMLPVTIQNVDQYLFYDSGCSSFGLFTSKYHFDRFANNDQAGISYNSSRHGDPIPVHHRTSDVVARFGDSEIPLKRVSYLEQYIGLQSTLGGLVDGGFLGNEGLLDCTLILDMKTSKYRIFRSSGHQQ